MITGPASINTGETYSLTGMLAANNPEAVTAGISGKSILIYKADTELQTTVLTDASGVFAATIPGSATAGNFVVHAANLVKAKIAEFNRTAANDAHFSKLVVEYFKPEKPY